MYSCPRCTAELQTTLYEGVEIETCPACEGDWLDAHELSQIVQQVERRFTAEELAALDALRKRGHRVEPRKQPRLPCPKCFGQKLTPFRYASTSGILLDKCPSCGGIWLDRHELEMVQALVEEWKGLLRPQPTGEPDLALPTAPPGGPPAKPERRSQLSFFLAVLRSWG